MNNKKFKGNQSVQSNNGLTSSVVLALLTVIPTTFFILVFISSLILKLESISFFSVISVPVVSIFLITFISIALEKYAERKSQIKKEKFIVEKKKYLFYRTSIIYGYYFIPKNLKTKFYISQEMYYAIEGGYEIEIEYIISSKKVLTLEITNSNNTEIPLLSKEEMRKLDNSNRNIAYFYYIFSKETIIDMITTIIILYSILGIWVLFTAILFEFVYDKSYLQLLETYYVANNNE